MGHIVNADREYRLLQQRLDRNVTGAPDSPTFMKILAGLLEATSGEVTLDGEDILENPWLVRERLGYLPQDFGFYPNLSGEKMLAYLLKRAASAIMLGWADHLVGAILGFVLGALLCAAVLAMWVKFIGMSGAIADSTIAPILLDRFPRVLALLPKEFDVIRSFLQ